jgi:hypothetical protein
MSFRFMFQIMNGSPDIESINVRPGNATSPNKWNKVRYAAGAYLDSSGSDSAIGEGHSQNSVESVKFSQQG